MDNEQTVAPVEGSPPPILVAVDGTNLLHRAHHAHASSDRRDGSGTPVWALWGLARMLAAATAEITSSFRAPAGLTIAIDGPREVCRRRLMDAGYKSTRREPNPDLEAQLAIAPEWLAACGFDVALFDGYEADDGCASAAKVAEAAGWRCVIVTSDRDALAHTSTATRVLRPVNGGGWDVYGTARIAAKYGTPKVHGAYAEFSALRGDPSDELPGVAGIGEKTAATVLCALHDAERTLADVYAGDEAACAALKPRHLALLTAGEENYRRNRRLMDAVLDLPVDLDAASQPYDEAQIRSATDRFGVTGADTVLLGALSHRVAATV